MRESLDLPNLPDFVTIKEAAKILGVSDKRVYAYIEEGRLPGVKASHVIMIPEEAVKNFQPKTSGRPRKHTPAWRTSPEDNLLLTTSIFVRIAPNQHEKLQQKLAEIKQSEEHIFPGTVARYIIQSKAHPEALEILLTWRSTTMPNETARKKALEAFRQELADVLDWGTAMYDEGTALLHT